jgi:formiminoglutamase
MTVAFRPPEIAMPTTAPDDPRVGHLLARGLAGRHSARAVIMGFPTDEGVRRNGGRPGAAAAPNEIRRLLYRLTPDAANPQPFIDLLRHSIDLGDLMTSSDLETDQQRLGAAVADVLAAGAFPIVLGGGHETAFGHFLGYVEAGLAVTLLNWDAHADVREPTQGRGHSGSPFRQALLHPSRLARGYVVAGLLPQSVAHAHTQFVRSHQGETVWRADLDPARVRTIYQKLRKPVLASFDIDAVDQAFAPGVSAPAAGGMTPDLWLEAAYQAGRSPAVASFDLVETNPSFDRDHQTARLAALTVWSVLRGLAERVTGRATTRARDGSASRGKRKKRK